MDREATLASLNSPQPACGNSKLSQVQREKMGQAGAPQAVPTTLWARGLRAHRQPTNLGAPTESLLSLGKDKVKQAILVLTEHGYLKKTRVRLSWTSICKLCEQSHEISKLIAFECELVGV